MKKRVSVIMLVAVLLMALCLPIFARYSYITQLSGGLSIDSSGLANCTGFVKPSNSATRTDLKVTLEHYINSDWSEIESWTNSGSGMVSITKSGKRYVDRGKYRVVVNAKVYDSSSGSLLEDESFTTSEKTY